jgi:hypothetical protein
MVSEEELKGLLKRHRWTLRDNIRSGDQKVYTAAQRQGKRTVTRYIGTANRLKNMTEEDVLAKLNKPFQAEEVLKRIGK